MKTVLFFLLLTTLTCRAGSSVSFIENLIFKGEFTKAKHRIKNDLKSSKGIEKAILYQSQGDILKIEGDIDEALRYWRLSNQIRSKRFKKKDYHLAWNYALLSNYYYEKIEPKLAVSYADSCSALIRNLNRNQQREIRVFKIWNIIAQSYKLGLAHIDKPRRLKEYENIRKYYLESIDFIQKEKFPKYYLAKSYHLLGNTYHDNIHDFILELDLNKFKVLKIKDQADFYYHKALSLWESEYGKVHFERSKTLYVMGIMYALIPTNLWANSTGNSLKKYKESLEALNVGPTTNINDWKIPNQQDALQCLRHYKLGLIKLLGKHSTGKDLATLNRLNQMSIKIWESMYADFKSKNLNMYLSIYNLVPYTDIIGFETAKRSFGLPWSIDTIFNANQMLKYYDLNRFKNQRPEQKTLSINLLQQNLRNDQLCLDIIDDNSFIFISKDERKFIVSDHRLYLKIEDLNKAILNNDFDAFVRQSSALYQMLFAPFNMSRFKRLDISPSSTFNALPFEVLLASRINIEKRDYSELDFLIKRKEIRYHLSFRHFLEKPTTMLFIGACFAPTGKSSSKLPFSLKLAETLKSDYGIERYVGEDATKNHYLKSHNGLLHFSGHGIIDPSNPTLSILDFGNNFLTLEDVYQIKEPPTFVVLNACNSFLGKSNIGDGVNGFARAYHAIGAKATISNLWEVDDQASNLLYTEFYSTLAKGGSTHLALRRAQLNFIEGKNGFDAPYYWAGHRLFGNIEIEEHKKTPNTLTIWIWGVLGLVGILLLFRFLLKSI